VLLNIEADRTLFALTHQSKGQDRPGINLQTTDITLLAVSSIQSKVLIFKYCMNLSKMFPISN